MLLDEAAGGKQKQKNRQKNISLDWDFKRAHFENGRPGLGGQKTSYLDRLEENNQMLTCHINNVSSEWS